MQQLALNKIFGGQQGQYSHSSSVLSCDMTFSVFLPPSVAPDVGHAGNGKVPVLYWLSGLTCDDQNFVTKAGAQQAAADYGIAIVCPDTSPRGDGVPDDPEAAWDFGLGAGFYVNATQAPWSEHYHMYDYIVTELPSVIAANFPIDIDKASISGHSMGGHGALTIGLKNHELYKSVSAFSPIVSPINCPWGKKALSQYIGPDRSDWLVYDSCELVSTAKVHMPLLIDQGLADSFLDSQLKTQLLVSAAEQVNYPVSVRYHKGYDHSYYFIASFIEDHIAFHAEHLS